MSIHNGIRVKSTIYTKLISDCFTVNTIYYCCTRSCTMPHRGLGFMFNSNGQDDEDMLRHRRNLYIRSNKLLRIFHYCSSDVKLELFKSYCTSFYCCYLWTAYKTINIRQVNIIVYRPGYFTVHSPPAPSGPKFSNSENCCGSENAMPPKFFWDMEGHRGHFRSKNVFFFKKHIWKKFIINHTIFLNFRYAFFRY